MQQKVNTDAPIGTPLTIGSVIFNNIEHPEDLAFPLEQKVATNELLGGNRVVQTLGVQPQDVSWRGKLFDQHAKVRVDALNDMLTKGDPVTLAYLHYAMLVVVSKFTPTWHNEWFAEYDITVTVVNDRAGQFTKPNVPSIDTVISQLGQQAQTNFAKLNALTPASSAESAVKPPSLNTDTIMAQLQTMGAYNTASSATIASIQSLIASDLTTLTTYNAGVKKTMNNGVYSPNVLTAYSAGNDLQNSLQMLATNLSNGQNPITAQVMGGTLYRLAAKYYGDPSLFTVIKTANNLTSSVLPNGVVTTLTIPPSPTAA